ncbi:MAG: hypothetical protein QM736_12260 [Vicinamibacterales bacterium]
MAVVMASADLFVFPEPHRHRRQRRPRSAGERASRARRPTKADRARTWWMGRPVWSADRWGRWRERPATCACRCPGAHDWGVPHASPHCGRRWDLALAPLYASYREVVASAATAPVMTSGIVTA